METEDNVLTVGLSGNVDDDNGNGIICLAGKVISSGFSVDRVIHINGAAKLIALDSITTAEKINSKLEITLSNDLFVENLSADMFTLGEALAGYQVKSVLRENALKAVITVYGGTLRKPAKGSITLSGAGSQSGRTVSGYITIANPTICVLSAKGFQTEGASGRLYRVLTGGDGFTVNLTAEDIVLKGGLSGMTITDIKQ